MLHPSTYETDSSGTWWSPRGVPLGPGILAKVDIDLLAEMYREEEQDLSLPIPAWDAANTATRHAWAYGYRNPRIPLDADR